MKLVRGETELEICVHGCTWKGRVLILDGVHEELILRIDCLKGLKIHIDLENDLLHFENDVKVPIAIMEDGTIGKVRVKSNTILPARTALFNDHVLSWATTTCQTYQYSFQGPGPDPPSRDSLGFAPIATLPYGLYQQHTNMSTHPRDSLDF